MAGAAVSVEIAEAAVFASIADEGAVARIAAVLNFLLRLATEVPLLLLLLLFSAPQALRHATRRLRRAIDQRFGVLNPKP
jgi:hypothetical protein